MHFQKSKIEYVLKRASGFICLFVFLLLTMSFASNNNTNAPYFVREPSNEITPQKHGAFREYSMNEGPLYRYLDRELMEHKSLANYHEENYIYANGNHGLSYYDGILTHVIKDFDNDKELEMAIFKIKTDSVDEYSNKEITIEMIKAINGVATKVDEMVLSSEQYLGEELECSIAMKYVNDGWRIYLDYCDKKVRDGQFENKFKAIEYINTFNVISEVNLSGNEDDFEQSADFQDQVIDAGVNLIDDANIYKRCFINYDMNMIPIFSIKRVNEKIKEGFIDDYFAEHGMEDENGEFRRLRYGYTNFIDRISEREEPDFFALTNR